ncbi:MAG: NifB/NifX family molybdenum-iron cluster-binding protein [Clostridiaceae bacterium]|nr:NifB/NifX family molybdenum-iron cluster-binding protein [Eubacteriales bacterium]
MRIAVAYENGNIFQHFGHTERFKVYDVENGEVTVATTVNTNGSGHGALADILKKIGADTLICGGIGAGAKRALAEAGITLYGGVSGDADEAVADLLAKRLKYDPDVACEHHGEHHHGEHHHGEHHHGSCGEHEGGCKD